MADSDLSEIGQSVLKLRQSSERLAQGLSQIVGTQAVHTAILKAVLEAATTTTEPEGDLQSTLLEILVSLGDQNKLLEQLVNRLVPSINESLREEQE